MPLVSQGLLFGQLNEKQKETVLERVGQVAAERFETYVNALVEAFDFREPRTREEKLALWRGRPQQEWAQMQAQNPKDYEEQVKSWVNMERLNAFMRLHPRQGPSQASPLPISDNTSVSY